MNDSFANAMDRLRQRISQAQNAGAPAGGFPAGAGGDDVVGNAANTAARGSALLEGLNPQQREAVEYEGSHLLVVAGAGSGKTRVLTTRISYLIATGRRSPGEILAITFTNKAANEMRERLEQMVGPIARRMWISTFHSACVRILRAEHEALGMRSTFTIYDSADSQRLMKMVLREEGIDSKQFPVKKILRKVSDLKNEVVTAREFEQGATSAEDRVIAQAYSAYQSRLRVANAVDFDDLIMLTVQLLRSNPQIAEHYRRRFRHVLVDEYQDTNTAQYELVRALVGSKGDEPRGELTVVGDADQSIYAFRGATIRNIESFEEDFPDAKVVLLEQNYRSTQNILTAANAVISNNQGRRPKRLWTDLGEGEKLVGYVADAETDEAAFVVEELDALRDKGYKYSDFAVFYRTNAQSRALEEMFVRSGIPYRVVGGTKFYERKEIKDAIAYLQAIANPDDTVSIRRIINEPRRGIGAKAEDALAAHASRFGISFGSALLDVAHPEAAAEAGRTEVIGLQARAANVLTEFSTMLEELRQKAEAGEAPAEILDQVMDRSGYLEVLQLSKDPQDEVRVENLAEFHAVASDFLVANPGGTLGDFLDQVSLVADSDQIPDDDAGQVVLMTVHTAKGLEFPVVFVTGMEDGTFPHMRSLGSAQELAEERRLAYVALTRARQRLYLTRAAARSQWGAPQELPASRFLEEIPPEVIEWRREESSMDTLRGGSGWGSRGGSSWGAGSRAGRGGSRRREWEDDDFAPPIGTGKFVPGKLGVSEPAGGPGTPGVGGPGGPGGPGPSGLGPGPAGPAGGTNAPTRPATNGLKIGDRVKHKSFGAGKVVDFDGVGKSTVAKVRFDSGATKRLMLRFAPLEKI